MAGFYRAAGWGREGYPIGRQKKKRRRAKTIEEIEPVQH
jgi:hypothetical protein